MPQVKEIAETTKRMSPGDLDDSFCDHYLNTGGDRCESYRLACKDSGKEYREDYVKQYAKRMFDRLSHKISDMLDHAEIEDATLARNALRMILMKSDASDASIIAAARELARKRTDKLEISKAEDTIDQVEAKILLIERELRSSELVIDVDVIDTVMTDS